jgi:multicomponent Na+:H+ antiporter subunit E
VIARATVLIWLSAAWVALWGDLSAANVISGLVAGLIVVAAVPLRGRRQGRIRVRPLRLLRFVAYFAIKLVEASIAVAWEVVTPQNWRLNEGIVAVRLRSASGPTLAVLANAISLTPGTIVVDVRARPPVLYVHVLLLRSVTGVRHDVLHLESLLTRAIVVESPRDETAMAPPVTASVGR